MTNLRQDLTGTDTGYRAVELFAGIGGFRLACDNLGIRTVWANDMDPAAVSVYRDRFGWDSIVQGDINSLIESVPEHDILTGGFPCQPFSKAGKKMGTDDYRGTLFESIVRIVSFRRPRFFVLENVNSLLFMQGGRNFRTILNALSGLGYKVEWRVFNAMEFGVPQHRERVIILGSRDGSPDESYFTDMDEISRSGDGILQETWGYGNWDSITGSGGVFCEWGMAYDGRYVTRPIEKRIVKGISLNDILQEPSEVPDCYDFTEDTLIRIENSVFVNKLYNGVRILYNQKGGSRMGYTIFGTDGVSPTLTASSSRHYERYRVGDRYRRLTPVEYARLQGFPDDHCRAVPPGKQYKLYGNAVPRQVVENVLGLITKRGPSSI